MFLYLFITGIQAIWAQGVSISGKTTDGTTGEALPGVIVQVNRNTRMGNAILIKAGQPISAGDICPLLDQ